MLIKQFLSFNSEYYKVIWSQTITASGIKCTLTQVPQWQPNDNAYMALQSIFVHLTVNHCTKKVNVLRITLWRIFEIVTECKASLSIGIFIFYLFNSNDSRLYLSCTYWLILKLKNWYLQSNGIRLTWLQIQLFLFGLGLIRNQCYRYKKDKYYYLSSSLCG